MAALGVQSCLAQDGEIDRELTILRSALRSGRAAAEADAPKASRALIRTTPDVLYQGPRAEVDSALSSDEPAAAAGPTPIEMSAAQREALHDAYDARTRAVQSAAKGPLDSDKFNRLDAEVRRLSSFVALLKQIASATDRDAQNALVGRALKSSKAP